MVDDPIVGWGLRPVELADRGLFDACFASLSQPISDYTFSQLFTWRNSLRILWKCLDGHLCVFANGTGDLTLLLPPIGDTGGDATLAAAFVRVTGLLDRPEGLLRPDRALRVLGHWMRPAAGSRPRP
jgi:hypothetical protein